MTLNDVNKFYLASAHLLRSTISKRFYQYTISSLLYYVQKHFVYFQFIITGILGIFCARRKTSYVVSNMSGHTCTPLEAIFHCICVSSQENLIMLNDNNKCADIVYMKVKKRKAKIRNRYNQEAHLA